MSIIEPALTDSTRRDMISNRLVECLLSSRLDFFSYLGDSIVELARRESVIEPARTGSARRESSYEPARTGF